MWVVKTKGESYYVEHVDCKIGWSTKETPDNSHTKGSIKIKNCLLVIDDSNVANITEITDHDKVRLRNREKGITRVITSSGYILRENLKQSNIKHGPIRSIGGACSTTFYIVDILKKSHLSILMLNMSNTDLRILKENEGYYKVIDDPKYINQEYIDEDDWYDDDDDDDTHERDTTADIVSTEVQDKALSFSTSRILLRDKFLSIKETLSRKISTK